MNAEERARFSADLGRSALAAGPPGYGEIERVRDVLVIAGNPEVDNQSDTEDLIMLPKWEGHPATGKWGERAPIELGRGLRIEHLNHDEAELVMNACSPRGHYFVPVRQFGQMYSLVVDIDLEEIEERRWVWNTNSLISDALTISRLVLDNGYSYEYAARVFDHADAEQHIMPASVLQHAYRLRKTREWLTEEEAQQLRELLAKFWAVKDELPERVDHALWLAEYVVSVRWLDVMAPLLVVAFEALVNTSKALVTRQFTERVCALTEEVGAPLSASHCERMYDSRSRFVHGRRVSLYEGKGQAGPTGDEQKAALERIAKTQDALRAVLRRCIEDAEFRGIFAHDESIRERWPVAV
jgi:hypothetical protein